MPRLLIIDDEKPIRASLRDILEYEHYEVEEADSGLAGIEMLKKNTYDAILCDIKMPKMDGIEVLEQAHEWTDAPFIMISGHGTIETAVETLKKGAYDFIAKPLDLNRLLVSVRNALERKALVAETKKLKRKIQKSETFIGQSLVVREVLEMVDKVAPTDARVLIQGKNGTGKEIIARRIHAMSRRANNPLIEVNCAAIPSELIESELFGHEKGAFTSAIKQRIGTFEQAQGGTLFLDEVGDMSLSAQAKVLRALQENTINRIGGEKSIRVDVRIVAATNKDLLTEIAEGRFREDLYHRLNVVLIQLPPLCDRLDDIPLLVEHFIQELSENNGRAPIQITPEALNELKKRRWTGNIRELRNIVERLLIFCDQSISETDIRHYAP